MAKINPHWTLVIHWCDPVTYAQSAYVSDPHGNKTAKQYSYMLGDLSPNYPVPAIRHAVTIDYEFIAIWDVGKGLAYYLDDYETVFTY